MNTSHHHDFDPFSEESLNAVEMVEFLPDSIAFDHVMYDYRIERIASYEYKHSKTNDNDLDPIVIDSHLMSGRFPESLRGIFPEVDYTIKQLQIAQIEGGNDSENKPQTKISFLANEVPHSAIVRNGVVQYETYNHYLEPVQYELSSDDIIGLIAAFLYAKQYDMNESSHPAVELAESAILTQRDPQVDLTERMIMTLGDLSGSAQISTQAMFDNVGSPIVAVLVNKESPDASAVNNSLTLNEMGNINDIPTSIETTIYQNIVSIQHDSAILRIGKLANRFAEQRSTVLSSLPISTSEYIDPKENHERWARTCISFMDLIKIPMSVYSELDETLETDLTEEDDNEDDEMDV